jgi:hypothetical protein
MLSDIEIHTMWLERPAELLRAAREGLYTQAMMYRAKVTAAVPVAEAQTLLKAGEKINFMSLWRGLPKGISETGEPGMSADEFAKTVVAPAKDAVLVWQQFQRERAIVVCSRSVQITDVLIPLVDLALNGTHTSAFMALTILYTFDLLPARWLPNCPSFSQTVPLYEFFHGPTICNPFAVCTLLQTQLSLWIKLTTPPPIIRQQAMLEPLFPSPRSPGPSPRTTSDSSASSTEPERAGLAGASQVQECTP